MPIAHKATIKEAKIKALVWGEAGSHKTRFALSFPAPLLIDLERGSDWYADQFDFFTAAPSPGLGILDLVDRICEEIMHGEYPDRHTLIIDPVTDWLDALQMFYIGRLTVPLNDLKALERARAYGWIRDQIRAELERIRRIPWNVVFVARARSLWGKDSDNKVAPIGKIYDAAEIIEYLSDLVIEAQRGGTAKIIKSRMIAPVADPIESSYSALRAVMERRPMLPAAGPAAAPAVSGKASADPPPLFRDKEPAKDTAEHSRPPERPAKAMPADFLVKFAQVQNYEQYHQLMGALLKRRGDQRLAGEGWAAPELDQAALEARRRLGIYKAMPPETITWSDRGEMSTRPRRGADPEWLGVAAAVDSIQRFRDLIGLEAPPPVLDAAAHNLCLQRGKVAEGAELEELRAIALKMIDVELAREASAALSDDLPQMECPEIIDWPDGGELPNRLKQDQGHWQWVGHLEAASASVANLRTFKGLGAPFDLLGSAAIQHLIAAGSSLRTEADVRAAEEVLGPFLATENQRAEMGRELDRIRKRIGAVGKDRR